MCPMAVAACSPVQNSGAERFQAVSKAFYRGAGAAIVCFDLNDLNNFEKVPHLPPKRFSGQ